LAAPLPPEHTCQGKEISPTLDFSAIPIKGESLALIVDDPDAPGSFWDRWMA
jgi:phosphatidylethanolamine-binding protein (PEBP) family uncharacterized protein